MQACQACGESCQSRDTIKDHFQEASVWYCDDCLDSQTVAKYMVEKACEEYRKEMLKIINGEYAKVQRTLNSLKKKINSLQRRMKESV